MSSNRRNNHYHYAEKFEPKRSRSGKTVFIPFKTVIISLVVLLMFGLVSTTFGAYISENEPEYDPDAPGIITEVRNIKASREVSLTGANVDLASTGEGWMTMNGGGYFIFDNTNSGWSDVQMLVGRRYNYGNDGVFCRKYNMTQITGTNLYALQISDWSTSGDGTHIYDIVFVTGTSSWGSDENSSPVDRRTYATHYSAVYSNNGASFTSTGVYACSLASGSNNASVTITTITDTGYSYYNYNQTAHAYYKSSTGGYSKGTTGGTVSVDSGYELNSNTGSTDAAISNSSGTYTITAAKTSTLTLKATPATNYRFVGWFTSTTATSPTSTSDTISFTVTKANTATYYARFIKTYTVSIIKSPTAYTGTAPNFTYNSSNHTQTAVDVGSSITLNSNCSAPINCTFKLTSASGTTITSPRTITANTTIYAVYSLSAPTISSFSYGSPTVEGAADISPSVTASRASGNSGTLGYAFSFVSGGTGPSTGYSLDTSNGDFSASVAGTYKIRLTVTHTQDGLSAEATEDTTITVKPTPVTGISYEVTGHNSGAGTLAEPWKVPVNSTTFSITSFIPTEDRDSNYTYDWTRTDGTYVISSGTTTVGSHTATGSDVYLVTDTATSGTATADVIHNAVLAGDTQGYIYKIAVTKTRNSVESDPYYYTFYYGVTADFLVVNSFDFKSFNDVTGEEVQKIYAEDNGIDHIDADYDAGGTNFHTMLFFSKDNITDNKVAVWTPSSFTITAGNPFAGTHSALPNDTLHQISALVAQIGTTARNSVNLMSVLGPKWFKGYVDDYENSKIYPQYPVLHTTVGTSSNVANRPLYFIDSTGITHENTRVMVFYRVEDDGSSTAVHYQTGQVVSGRSNTYRFYIPSTATTVSFAYVADNSYVLPTWNGTGFSYTAYASTVLKAWTNTIDLTDSSNINMTTFKADTPGSPTNGIYNYSNTENSGKMTTLP